MRKRQRPYTASQVQQAMRYASTVWDGKAASNEAWNVIQDMLNELYRIKLAEEKLDLK